MTSAAADRRDQAVGTGRPSGLADSPAVFPIVGMCGTRILAGANCKPLRQVVGKLYTVYGKTTKNFNDFNNYVLALILQFTGRHKQTLLNISYQAGCTQLRCRRPEDPGGATG